MGKSEVKEKGKGISLFKWIVVLILSFSVGMSMNFFLKPTNISGDSMYPTLEDGNRVLLNSFKSNYNRGDIVVFSAPDGRYYVKRVVALPGEKIEISEGTVYLNDEELDEPYLHDAKTYTDGSLTVPEDEYFMMGDNRGNSFDSREIGTIHHDKVVGSLLVRMFPPKPVDMSKAHVAAQTE